MGVKFCGEETGEKKPRDTVARDGEGRRVMGFTMDEASDDTIMQDETCCEKCSEPTTIPMPCTVRIGHLDYKILSTDDPILLDGRQCYGAIAFEDAAISMDTTFPLEHQKHTLLHEVVHGIDSLFGCDLSEEQTDDIAKGIMMVIRDNPELVRFVYERTQ